MADQKPPGRADTTEQAKAAAEASKLEAEAGKLAAETRKLDLETEVARWNALTPDFSAVKRGDVALPSERIGRSAMLGWKALEAAASKVADEIREALPAAGTPVILVTSDVDLASAGAAYLEVRTTVEAVIERARLVRDKHGSHVFKSITPVVAAGLGALPGLISMLGINRSQDVGELLPDDEAAGALVCGALLKADEGRAMTLVDDRFRIVEETGIWTRLADLEAMRAELYRVRTELFPPGAAPVKPGTPEAQNLAEIEAAIASVAGLEASLRSVPNGRQRSPIVEAALYERLFPDAGNQPRFSHVLLIRSEGGQVQRDVVDRPAIIGPDTINLLAEAAISYRLLDVAGNRLVAAGLVSGQAQAFGTLGGRLTVCEG